MYLLSLRAVVASLGIVHQAAGVWGYPSPKVALPAAGEGDYQLESRAPPAAGSIEIPMLMREGHDTWVGYRVNGFFGGGAVSDDVVRGTAYKTYESIKNKLPATGLVSVMYVPGGGWAAGSIWQGTDSGFKGFAAKAEAFWHSVPVDDQGFNPSLNGQNKWHAEAVAVAKAELEFERAMVDGLWPKGTKIYTYGRYWDNKIQKEGGKASCTDQNTQVAVSCKQWLGRLEVTIVPVPSS